MVFSPNIYGLSLLFSFSHKKTSLSTTNKEENEIPIESMNWFSPFVSLTGLPLKRALFTFQKY